MRTTLLTLAVVLSFALVTPAAAAPDALNGTNGSRVERLRTSSMAQNTPSPRTSPTASWLALSLSSAGPMMSVPSMRACSTTPSSSKMRIDATADAQASGCPE